MKKVYSLYKFTLFYIICVVGFLTVLPKPVFAEDASITIKSKVVKYNKKEFKSKLKVPVIMDVKDNSFKEELNAKFKNAAFTLRNEIEKSAREYAQEAEKEGYTIRPYIISTDYEINYNKGNILSITNGYYEYTGGAHGNYYYRSTTADLLNNKELILKDLFKPNYNYEKIISEEIAKKINLEKDLYFHDAIETVKDIPEDQHFYIENDTLVIYFDLYEIAPFSTGVPEFKIPTSLFKDSLNYEI